jgi:hypothetical protein
LERGAEGVDALFIGGMGVETGAGKIKFERSAISMELSKKYETSVESK